MVLCYLFLMSEFRMCVHVIFSSVWFAEWPPFGKELLTRLTICSLCIWTICNFSLFPVFGFEGWLLQLLVFSYFLLFSKQIMQLH